MVRPIIQVQGLPGLQPAGGQINEYIRISEPNVPYQNPGRGFGEIGEALQDTSQTIKKGQFDTAGSALAKYADEYAADREDFRRRVEAGQIPEFANPVGRDFFYRMDAAGSLKEFAVQMRHEFQAATSATGEDGHLKPAEDFRDVFARNWEKVRGNAAFQTRAGGALLAQAMPQLMTDLRAEYTEARLTSENAAKKVAIADRMSKIAPDILMGPILAANAGMRPEPFIAHAQEEFNQFVREAATVTPDVRSLVKQALASSLRGLPSGEAVAAALPLLEKLMVDGTGQPLGAIQEMKTWLKEQGAEAVRRIQSDKKTFADSYGDGAKASADALVSEWLPQIDAADPTTKPDLIEKARAAVLQLRPEFQGEAKAALQHALALSEATTEEERKSILDAVTVMGSKGMPASQIADYIALHRGQLGRHLPAAQQALAGVQKGEELLAQSGADRAVREVQNASDATDIRSVHLTTATSALEMRELLKQEAIRLAASGDPQAATKLADRVELERAGRVKSALDHAASRRKEIDTAQDQAEAALETLQDPTVAIQNVLADMTPAEIRRYERIKRAFDNPLYGAFGKVDIPEVGLGGAGKADVEFTARQMLKASYGGKTENVPQDVVNRAAELFTPRFLELSKDARKKTKQTEILDGIASASEDAMIEAVKEAKSEVDKATIGALGEDSPALRRYHAVASWATTPKKYVDGAKDYYQGAKEALGERGTIVDDLHAHREGAFPAGLDEAGSMAALRAHAHQTAGEIANDPSIPKDRRPELVGTVLGMTGISLEEAITGKATITYNRKRARLDVLAVGPMYSRFEPPGTETITVPIVVNPFTDLILTADSSKIGKALGYAEEFSDQIVQAQALKMAYLRSKGLGPLIEVKR